MVAALALFAAVLPRAAFATMNVNMFKGGLGPSGGNGTGQSFFYVGFTPTTPLSFNHDTDAFYYNVPGGYQYSDIDLSQTLNSEVFPSAPNAISFQVQSTVTNSTTTNGTIVVTAELLQSNGQPFSPTAYIPIATTNEARCDAVGCGTGSFPLLYSSGGTQLDRYLVPYTLGDTIVLAFYPGDICAIVPVQVTGSPLTQCSGSSVVGPLKGGQVTQFFFKFQLWAVDADLQHGPPGSKSGLPTTLSTSPIEESNVITVNFQNDYPSVAGCPNLNTSYEPGDGEILLETDTLSMGNNGGGALGGHAGPQDLVLVAQHTDSGASAPTPTSGMLSQVSTTEFFVDTNTYNNGRQPFSGFANTTNGSDDFYQVVLGIRDQTGLVAFASASSNQATTQPSCVLKNVQTSKINGFLKENACFIATATYRDPNAAPVVMLREFRDRILMHYTLGRDFVHWYYSWSPTGAAWLLEHPVFRYPVMVALAPLEVLAWLGLHPKLLLALAALIVSAISFFAYARGRLEQAP